MAQKGSRWGNEFQRWRHFRGKALLETLYNLHCFHGWNLNLVASPDFYWNPCPVSCLQFRFLWLLVQHTELWEAEGGVERRRRVVVWRIIYWSIHKGMLILSPSLFGLGAWLQIKHRMSVCAWERGMSWGGWQGYITPWPLLAQRKIWQVFLSPCADSCVINWVKGG